MRVQFVRIPNEVREVDSCFLECQKNRILGPRAKLEKRMRFNVRYDLSHNVFFYINYLISVIIRILAI